MGLQEHKYIAIILFDALAWLFLGSFIVGVLFQDYINWVSLVANFAAFFAFESVVRHVPFLVILL